jgi:hypothetical protein
MRKDMTMAIEALLALEAIEKDLAFLRENVVINHPHAQELIKHMMSGVRTIDAYLKRDIAVVSAKDPDIHVTTGSAKNIPVRSKVKSDVKPAE